MWVPVHNEEWDQDIPLDDTGRIITTRSKEPELGSVVFEGSTRVRGPVYLYGLVNI